MTGAGDKGGATSVRTLLAVHAHSAAGRSMREGQHQPWDGRKSPHGGTLAGKSHASVSWLWRPLITFFLTSIFPFCQICFGPIRNYLTREFSDWTDPYLAKRSNPFSQHRMRVSGPCFCVYWSFVAGSMTRALAYGKMHQNQVQLQKISAFRS